MPMYLRLFIVGMSVCNECAMYGIYWDLPGLWIAAGVVVVAFCTYPITIFIYNDVTSIYR